MVFLCRKKRSSYVRDAAAQKDVDDLAEWIPQGVIYDEPFGFVLIHEEVTPMEMSDIVIQELEKKGLKI